MLAVLALTIPAIALVIFVHECEKNAIK